MLLAFRSPGGTLDLNWAGAWDTVSANNIGANYADNEELPPGFPVTISQPGEGYILASTQSILYDDSRQALYAMTAAQVPDYSQNMRIYFTISRDNGQTWSNPIDISTTNFANRGYQSMALDSKTGNLVFSWYDGRNDPTYQALQYFGAVISSKKLDELVKKIPLSNPVYILPSVGSLSVLPNVAAGRSSSGAKR